MNHPLVVDLDGTLTPTDTLLESVVRLLKSRPLDVLRMPVWLLAGKSNLKAQLARRVQLSGASLPYRESLLDYLRQEKAKGRVLVLATAADITIARSVATHLDLFDHVMGSSESVNLKGSNKLALIRSTVGPAFSYAGDAAADLPIWAASQGAVLVGVSGRTRRIVSRGSTPIDKTFTSERAGPAAWLRALRVHQWLKNLLVFVPLLTAFAFVHSAKILDAFVAFVAFSLAASGTYLVNDLSDLEADRLHLRKRDRPIASGLISIGAAAGVSVALIGAALLLALAVGKGLMLVIATYVVVTTAYTWFLKRFVLLDVLTLAALYTIRILGGSVAIDVKTSSWLLAFSVFIFFSLALVKRCAELVALQEVGREDLRGRGYLVVDLHVLWPLGTGAGLCSVVVFGLFVSNDAAAMRYATVELMWVVAFLLLYWLARLWIKTVRGEMHDDPLVYAVRDRTSRLTVAVMVLAVLLAYFVKVG